MHRLWIAILLFPPATLAGTIYKCKNPEGVLLYQATPCTAESQPLNAWKSEREQDSGQANASLAIAPGRGGHYYVDATIDGHFLNFMVDTGASLVTLPLATARDAGLRCESQGMLSTGNGLTRACYTTIRKLVFGSFTLYDVQAMVAPNLDQPLLGMNVLQRFRVEQAEGQMRLTRNY